MELSDGTVVERNLSQPLNVVGMYIYIDAYIYHLAIEIFGGIKGVHWTSLLSYFCIPCCHFEADTRRGLGDPEEIQKVGPII